MIINKRFLTISLLLLVGLNTGLASATIIDSSPTTLSAPEVSLDFNEIMMANGPVANEFAGFGVSFSPQLSYLNSISGRPNFSDAAILNFSAGTPFSLNFNNTVSEAVFAYTTNNVSKTFEALLNGAVVESFTSGPSAVSNPNNFYGFSNIAFDEIRVTSGQASAFDNLSFSTVAVSVPEPAPIALFAAGGFLLGRFRRKLER